MPTCMHDAHVKGVHHMRTVKVQENYAQRSTCPVLRTCSDSLCLQLVRLVLTSFGVIL